MLRNAASAPPTSNIDSFCNRPLGLEFVTALHGETQDLVSGAVHEVPAERIVVAGARGCIERIGLHHLILIAAHFRDGAAHLRGQVAGDGEVSGIDELAVLVRRLAAQAIESGVAEVLRRRFRLVLVDAQV